MSEQAAKSTLPPAGVAAMASLADDGDDGTTPSGGGPVYVMPLYARISVLGIFIIMAVGSLFFAANVFIPVTLAIVLSLTLKPVVRFLEKLYVPPALSAVVLALSIVGGVVLAGSIVVGPLTDLIDRAPTIRAELGAKLQEFRAPMEAVVEAGREMERVTGGTGKGVQTVTVEGPSIWANAADTIIPVLTSVVIVFVLVIFLLASGDMFTEKLVRSIERFRDKKRAVRTLYDIQREVSRYLLTITVINAALGVAVGAGLHFLGMPDAHVWGVIAAVANFIPYIGSLIGMIMSGLVALVTFDTVGAALLVPAWYFFCTFLEGQFLTPLIVGRRLQINAVVIFVSVAFWAWLWGLVGALLAVPILVIVKTLCSHYPKLHVMADFLSGDAPQDPDVPEAESRAEPGAEPKPA